MVRKGSGWLVLVLSSLALACNNSKSDSTAPAASAPAVGSIVVNAMQKGSTNAATRRAYVPRPMASGIPIPSGPRLAILAGQGVGPIQVGATVKTIERHMDLPCDVLTDNLCRYIARAVDFHLEDGVVRAVVVHRRDRPAGKDKRGKRRVFGIFNGAIPPDFQVMMKRQVIMEHLGPPLKTETVQTPNEFNTLERHYYDGLVAEYDRYDNGQVVLGGLRIEKAKTKTEP